MFRTFPEIPYFSKEGEGCASLQRILVNLCKLDQGRGYLQGMNFLAACLLLHSDEILAFYFLETLLAEYELREVYTIDFIGLYKHCKILDAIMNEKMFSLQNHFKENYIEVDMFSSDWIISLFTSSIPLSKTRKLFNLIFKDGWLAIYKMIITILKTFESDLLKINESGDILVALKNNEMFLQNF